MVQNDSIYETSSRETKRGVLMGSQTSEPVRCGWLENNMRSAVRPSGRFPGSAIFLFCFFSFFCFVCFCFLLSSSMAQLPLDVLPKTSTLPSYHISCGHRSFWSDTRPPVRFKRSTVGTRKTKILYDNASLTKSSSLCHTRISKISIFSSRTLQHSHNKTKSWPTSAT